MPISVLVVDDHAVFADAVAAQLAAEPCFAPVRVGYSVAEGRERLKAHPDVAVLDLNLADGTALDLVRSAHRDSPATHLVILSASAWSDAMVTAVRLGLRAWLPKTVDSQLLIRTVRGVCSGAAYFQPQALGRLLAELTAPVDDPLAVLTAREREVLDRMATGMSRSAIADDLGLSINTVRTHTQNLLGKLNVHSALEAVAVAMGAQQDGVDPR